MEILDRLHRLMGQRDACVAQIAVLREQMDVSREERERVQRERDEAVQALRTARALSAQAQRERDEARAEVEDQWRRFHALMDDVRVLKAILATIAVSGVESRARGYSSVQIDDGTLADLHAALAGTAGDAHARGVPDTRGRAGTDQGSPRHAQAVDGADG